MDILVCNAAVNPTFGPTLEVCITCLFKRFVPWYMISIRLLLLPGTKWVIDAEYLHLCDLKVVWFCTQIWDINVKSTALLVKEVHPHFKENKSVWVLSYMIVLTGFSYPRTQAIPSLNYCLQTISKQNLHPPTLSLSLSVLLSLPPSLVRCFMNICYRGGTIVLVSSIGAYVPFSVSNM